MCDVAEFSFFCSDSKMSADVFDVDDAAVRVEHLDEPAHVRAFEFLRQIHKHADGGHGVLDAARLVAHLDGKAQPAHADLVNAQFARVALALLVVQRRGGSFPCCARCCGVPPFRDMKEK